MLVQGAVDLPRPFSLRCPHCTPHCAPVCDRISYVPQDVVVASVRVVKLGNSSVQYEVGVFREPLDVQVCGCALSCASLMTPQLCHAVEYAQVKSDGSVETLTRPLCWDPSSDRHAECTTTVAARGEFTHVFVDRESQRPVPISGKLRDALQSLVVDRQHSKL